MTQSRRDEHQPDPWAILTGSLRQMRRMDFDDLRRGLENFARPSAAGLMDALGRTREQRVERMAEMLRNSSEADMEEMATIFALAMARLAEERTGDQQPVAPPGAPAEPARHRRDLSAAEWRRERRRAS